MQEIHNLAWWPPFSNKNSAYALFLRYWCLVVSEFRLVFESATDATDWNVVEVNKAKTFQESKKLPNDKSAHVRDDTSTYWDTNIPVLTITDGFTYLIKIPISEAFLQTWIVRLKSADQPVTLRPHIIS